MKKYFLLLFLSFCTLGLAQKKKSTPSKSKSKKTIVVKETVTIYTEEEAEVSNETRIVAGFLKQNPDHPRANFFKRRLFDLVMASPAAEDNNIATATSEDYKRALNETKKQAIASNTSVKASAPSVESSKASSKNSATRSVGSSAVNPEHKRTADLLTHIFNNDPTNNQAYINFNNRTSCALEIKIKGKKSFTLHVPAKNQNYVLLDKGSYTISTMVCDVQYTSTKNVTKDIDIALSLN